MWINVLLLPYRSDRKKLQKQMVLNSFSLSCKRREPLCKRRELLYKYSMLFYKRRCDCGVRQKKVMILRAKNIRFTRDMCHQASDDCKWCRCTEKSISWDRKKLQIGTQATLNIIIRVNNTMSWFTTFETNPHGFPTNSHKLADPKRTSIEDVKKV